MRKISVIVAAYNVEKYIEKAMESLVNQTFQDCEFIVINDASTDNTLEIINAYAKRDERIKVVNCEKNIGSFKVRKMGIEQSNGEYIMFLDADDFLENDACEKAYNAIKTEKVDVLQFETKIFADGDNTSNLSQEIEQMYDYLKSPVGKFVADTQDGILGIEEIAEGINFNVWNKIYARDMLCKVVPVLPDEHIILDTDLLFSYMMCYFARSYSYSDNILYNYRFGNGISTTHKLSREHMDAFSKVSFVYKTLEDFTDNYQLSDICKKRLKQIKSQIFYIIGKTFLNQIDVVERNDYLNKVLKWLTVEEFLSSLYCYAQLSEVIDYGIISRICSELEFFKTKTKNIKTVATFYRRMYNGGAENVVAKLVNLWVENGYNVVLFTNEEPNKDDYYISPEVKRVILPAIAWQDVDSFENRCRILRENLEKYSVDVMVYHSWNDYGLVLDGLLTKSLGIPFVVHTHNAFCIDTLAPSWWGAYTSLNMYSIYSFCDLVIALSKSDCAYWRAMGLNCIHTVNPSGISLETNQSDLNGNTVVMVSRISQEKQIEDGIKIIKKVIEKIPDAKLVIVGDGDNKAYVSEIDALIKEYGLEETIFRAGFQNDVIPYYQKSDVFLMTSKYEGAPLTVMESKICGLPLVSYDMPNLDTLRNPKGTFVVQQGDVESAAEKIVQILSDDELKRKMGKEARQSAEEILKVNLAEHWENIFKRLSHQNTDNETDLRVEDVCGAIKTLVHYTKNGLLVRYEEDKKNNLLRIKEFERYVADSSAEIQRILKEYEKLEVYSQKLIQENQRILKEYDKADAYIKKSEEMHQNISKELSNNIKELNDTLDEIRASASYRLGAFMTAVPRKIKNIIKKQKHK